MNKFIELTKDKIPTHSLEKFSLNMDNLDNAGILLNNNVVLVDFDGDNGKAEHKIIDFLKLKYPTLTIETTRGVHFYYARPQDVKIKNSSDCITFGGFQVDYKTGTHSIAVVKLNGTERKANRPLNLDNLPDLPPLLYQLSPKYANLCNLMEGDGRNDGLYKHIKVIRPTTEKDALFYANFINDCVFNEPLPKKELENTVKSAVKSNTITDEHFNYKITKKDDCIDFAKWLVKKYEIKFYNNVLYYQLEDRYQSDLINLQRIIISEQALNISMLEETIKQLRLYAELIPQKKKFNIRFRNGTLSKNIVAPMTKGFTPFYIDVDYNEEAYNKDVDNFLDFIAADNKEVRLVIEEILGHILMTRGFLHKIYFLAGDGNNGKSTFIEMITKFIGTELTSHIDIDGFKDGTQVSALIGKLVNLADDIDPEYIEKSKTLKTMASGNTISVRPIYSYPINIENIATLLFTCNTIPTFKDKTNGIKRRVEIIPFSNKIKNPDFDLLEKLSTDEAKSYILNLALQGMTRLIKNKKHTESEEIKEAIHKYEVETDNVMAFLDYIKDQGSSIDGNSVKEVKMQYEIFCEENGFKPAKTMLTRRLKDFGYEYERAMKDGKRTYFYSKNT